MFFYQWFEICIIWQILLTLFSMYYYNIYFQKCASYIGLTHLHRLNSKVCKQRFKMRRYISV